MMLERTDTEPELFPSIQQNLLEVFKMKSGLSRIFMETFDLNVDS